MIEIPNSKLATIQELAASLCDMLKSLHSPPEVPIATQDRVNAKVEAGLCLVCDKPLGPGSARGLCQDDYNEAQYKINKRRITESELIVLGFMTPKPMRGQKKSKPKTTLEKEIEAARGNAGIDPADMANTERLMRRKARQARTRKERK